jgi:hypothetical protein
MRVSGEHHDFRNTAVASGGTSIDCQTAVLTAASRAFAHVVSGNETVTRGAFDNITTGNISTLEE